MADDFAAKAAAFHVAHAPERIALEKCLESKINDDINFVCREPKSAYLKALADTFCKSEYDAGVACQKGAGEAWASRCFKENVAFGQCTDKALKKLYIYGLQNNKKNPAAQGQQ